MLEIFDGTELQHACYCDCGTICGCTCIANPAEQIGDEEYASDYSSGTVAQNAKNQDLFR